MAMPSHSSEPFSLAVFGPQSKQPTGEYLTNLRSFLVGKEQLKPLLQTIEALPETWKILADRRRDIASMNQGPRYMHILSDWIRTGEQSELCTLMSSILVLPLLTTIQVGQYFQFLELKNLRHHEFMAQVREGGVQGYCGGLLPAAAIACSKDENDVVTNASKAVRLALCIGAYAELGDDEADIGPTSMVVRLKAEGQGEEIVGKFPHAYISAITDPRTLSVVGPASVLTKLLAHVKELGLSAQIMHIRGKVHNPENADIVKELFAICEKNDSLQFPARANVIFRSNKNGAVIQEGRLTHEVVDTILASKCEWYQLLTQTAEDLQRTNRQSHLIAAFGIGDYTPLLPFNKAGLKVSKLDVLSFIKSHAPSPPIADSKSLYKYPPGAIAVIGAACRMPGANDLEELWNLISTGESRAEEVPVDRINIPGSFRATQDAKWASKQKFFGNFIDHVDCFDNGFFKTSPREAASMDPQQRVLLETAVQAMESSGYLRSHRREAGDRVGCFIGGSFVEYLDNTSANPPTAYTSTGTIRAFLCGKISYHFGWSGPAEVLDTACSSSLVAVNRACKAIQTDECPMALAGGVNIMTGIHNFMDLGKAGFLSPTGQCKPFDRAADGYCRGEGVGLVVLKRLSQALEDGDKVLGVIPGMATNQGGLSSTITVPSSPAQVSLYEGILRQAGLTPSQISYVEAHGTGTQAGDPLEVASIAQVFGGPQRAEPISIGSIKGNMGHLEVAAGIAGLIKALVMINKSQTPPLASHKNLNPKLGDLNASRLAISSTLQPWKDQFRAAMINSYGAAGSNAAVLLCQGPQADIKVSMIPASASQTYPIILSASSKDSLLMYAASLERHISVADSGISIGDLAFTLAEKRARLRYRWVTKASNVSELCKSLKAVPDCFEAPQQSKRVVLAFSGQTKQTIGLDKSWYESCALLKHHINQCNNVLKQLGFGEILPAVFATESAAIPDVISLQCGTFAVQYASARCWIDCGLHVDAVVGHSFGELTALVVSGVLSLEDGMKLVATRASLMKTRWGPDRGAMLAIHGTVDVVRSAIENLPPDHRDVEIACYNSPASQVAVGTDSSLVAMEQLLIDDPRFRGIKYQRLDVSHGFHSRFTKDILEDLTSVADSMVFNPPTIPLETCTLLHFDRITPDHIPRHTRQPVYFCDAIRRIEERLGPCVWLEAGMNSPIIPMIKRAVESPDRHVFDSIKVKAEEEPLSALLSTTLDLWREAIDVTFWNCRLAEQVGLKQIWLPPYQFERTPHWMPFTDHVMEALRNRPAIQNSESGPEKAKEPLELVSSPATLPKNEFAMNLSAKRFVQIVSGHAVLGRPLCPASMYMECALMAVQLSVGPIENQALWFENLTFDAPLGVNSGRKGSMALERDGDQPTWNFTARSSSEADPKSRLTPHAKGRLGFTRTPQFHAYQRLVNSRMSQFTESQHTESLRGKRAYSLFSRIVSYASILKGISVITMGDYEAVASIDVPSPDETGGANAATKLCDTISLDTFIQVAGLLINSSNQCGHEEAFLATGVDHFSMSLDCDFNTCRSWTVYATFTPVGDTKASGDVYVFRPDGTMVLLVTGVQFTKIPVARLEKMLESANNGKAPQKSDASKQVPQTKPGLTPTTQESRSSDDGSSSTSLDSNSQTSLDSESETSSDGDRILADFKAMIASYVGLAEDQLVADASMADLGVDSLAASELATELEDKFSKEVDGGDLIGMTFGELSNIIAPSAQKVSPSQSNAPLSDASQKKPPAAEQRHSEGAREEPREASQTVLDIDPVDALITCQESFDEAAQKCGFKCYWRDVAPDQDRLLLAYVAETFGNLGINLWELKPGAIVPQPVYETKHSRLMHRLWDVLKRLGVTSERGPQNIRTSKSLPDTPSATILDEVLDKYPKFGNENRLMAVTAPRLADCMTGKTDPVDLLFAKPYSQECLGDFYANSPQLATATELLLSFVSSVTAGSNKGTVKILEVGAGFGGTTARLAKTLEGLGRPVEYTFTDISSLLVRNAKKRFAEYDWMRFQTLNIEKDPDVSLQGKYDFVLGTNIVHATTSIVNSTRRMRSMLKEDGFIVLSEVTRIIDWYDLVWGPLDGWWCMADGRDYPLQSSEYWMKALKEAGFNSTSCSAGASEESITQQLLVGSTRQPKVPLPSMSEPTQLKLRNVCRIETIGYKTVDDTSVMADIYWPSQLPERAMPIALMVHGGGFMTLSRKAVRHNQTRYLLDNGILPISLDFRLCPEINLIKGPMADVCDALAWAQHQLPIVALSRGFAVNPNKIVMVGWSTGGHLAMSTAWTSKEAGIAPPCAILGFYAPTDLHSQGHGEQKTRKPAGEYQERRKTFDKLRMSLSPKPITSYDSNGIDSMTSWIRPGDPRSDFVLGQFREGRGVADLLHDLHDDWQVQPTEEEVAAASPLAQVLNGRYTTPTYLIHSDSDEIVPHRESVAFVEALKMNGVQTGLLTVPNVRHIHDLQIEAGSELWRTSVGPGYDFLIRALEER